jgi:hypothetical protein
VPQNWLPELPQVSGTQPAFTQTLFVQDEPAAQVPQSSPCPQPSPMVPQKLVPAAAHVAGTQLAPPTHRLLVQLQSALQLMPQSIVPLHPSPMAPQYRPPSGVHETLVLHVEPSAPASGTMMVVVPAVPVGPLPLLPAPAVEPLPPVLRIGPFETGPLEQLATATTAAR